MEQAKQQTQRVQLVRLRDITYKHLKKLNPNCTGEDLNAIEHDLIVWIKNFLLTMEEFDMKPTITFVGDNGV